MCRCYGDGDHKTPEPPGRVVLRNSKKYFSRNECFYQKKLQAFIKISTMAWGVQTFSEVNYPDPNEELKKIVNSILKKICCRLGWPDELSLISPY